MARATIPQISHFPLDDRDLDDADLWAVIDSAAASNSSLRSRNPLLSISNSSTNSSVPIPSPTFASPGPPKYKRIGEVRDYRDGEVVEEDAHWIPHKMGRFVENSSPSDGKNVVVIRQQQHQQQRSPRISFPVESPEVGCPSPHSLAGHFPSVALFKQYQNAAIAILEKSDYTMISGNPFIKKSGWRKISFYFNLSFEIKDKSIEYDENRNVVRAEFVVRAYMQSRFSDGWGSCERREKRFLRPNHDVPSTAETRAKNKACQDLLGVGQYQPGASGRSR